MSLLNTLNNLRKTALLRNVGLYGFSTFLNSSIPFFMLPVLTRYLSPEEYGIVSMYNIFTLFAIQLVHLNMISAYSRAYFAQDRFDHRLYLGTIIIAILCWWVVVSFVLWLLSGQLEILFSFPSSWIWAVSFFTLAQSLNVITQTSWQVREKPFCYGVYVNSKTFIDAGFAILFVVIFSWGWRGRIFSILLPLVVFAGIGLIAMCKHDYLKLSFDKKYLRHALSYGMPIVLHTIAGVVNISISRLFLTAMFGVAMAGIYSAGYQIGNSINLISIAFYQAFFPWAYRGLNENTEESKRKLASCIYIYAAFILTVSIALGTLAPSLMVFFLGKKFATSSIYVIWIAVGYAFNGIATVLAISILHAEKTKYYGLITPFAAVLNAALNYILIKTLGPVGAAISSTITYFVILVITFIMAQKFLPLPWKEVFTSVRMRVFKK